MKIDIVVIGHTKEQFLKSGIESYLKKLRHYGKIEFIQLKSLKTSDPIEAKKNQSERFLKYLEAQNYVICLDENGDEMTSIEFSRHLEKIMLMGRKKLVILIGGAFGIHEAIISRAQKVVSLSKMTFTHDMSRLILLEQVYRAFTILKNEPYHNP